MYPKPVDFKFFRDALKFIGLLFGIAACGMIYAITVMAVQHEAIGSLVLKSLDLVTIVVPPALPFAMSTGLVFAVRRLRNLSVFCISPASINTSGSINCVVFDKTGTLTEDGMRLKCVQPVLEESSQFGDPLDPRCELLPASRVLQCLSTCHSLVRMSDKLSGDPLDMALFESINWNIREVTDSDERYLNNTLGIQYPFSAIVFPNITTYSVCGIERHSLGIIRIFPFNSTNQRMCVVACTLQQDHEVNLFVKGSPEAVSQNCHSDSIPDNLDYVVHSYARHGYRLLAMAWRPLDKAMDFMTAKADELEGEQQLRFLGLVVTENKLKWETKGVLEEMLLAKLKLVMATGDNLSTAISVARDSGLVFSKDQIYIVNVTKLSDGISISYQPAEDDTFEFPVHYTDDKPYTNSKTSTFVSIGYAFALNGTSWRLIKEFQPDLLTKICVKGAIFARMSPTQKKDLIETLQSIDYAVLMCGDGANDCEALSTAHTGVALSEAEASIAAAFTAKQHNVASVLSVLKEGRCTLVTSFGMFKFMASYSLTQFTSCLILYWVLSNLTDWEFLYEDLIVITPLCVTFSFAESYTKLYHKPPHFSLLSIRTVFSILVHILIIATVQITAFLTVKLQPWYLPFHKKHPADYKCFENSAVFFVSVFQFIMCAVSFSRGPPYRKQLCSNIPFVLNLIAVFTFTTVLVFNPTDWIMNLFHMESIPSFRFKLFLFGLVIMNALLVFIFDLQEHKLDYVNWFQLLSKSKTSYPWSSPTSKYEDINDEMNKDNFWNCNKQCSPTTPNSEYHQESSKIEFGDKNLNSNNVDKQNKVEKQTNGMEFHNNLGFTSVHSKLINN